MKSDVNGCSTCKPGEEKFERFHSGIRKTELWSYDYRTEDGELFSCCKATLVLCREARNKWLAGRRARS